MKSSLILIFILAILTQPIKAQTEATPDDYVVTLVIEELIVKNIQEDGVVNSDDKDEIYIEYSLEERDSKGRQVNNNYIVGAWGIEELEKGDIVEAAEFDPISIRIADDSVILVKIRMTESDLDRQQFADLVGETCKSTPLPVSPIVCAGTLVFGSDDQEFDGPSPETFSLDQIGDELIQTVTFSYSKYMNHAEYDLTYSLFVEEASELPTDLSQATLIIDNRSEISICEVYLSEVSATDWGINWLTEDTTIPAGTTFELALSSGIYDILLVDCAGNDLIDMRAVDIQETVALNYPQGRSKD